jgi:hypothetical protein
MATTTTRLAPVLLATLLLAGAPTAHAGDARHVRWKHLSTKAGDLQPPNTGQQQTSVAVGDFDGDSDPDVIGKPYNWDAPRLDVWINEGPGR